MNDPVNATQSNTSKTTGKPNEQVLSMGIRLRKSLKTLFVGLLVGIAFAEVVLRIAGISIPKFFRVDDTLGMSHRPGVKGWWIREGKTYVSINSEGLRDRERSKVKPPGTIRIAVLGDSYVEAFNVPFEKAFTSVMERELGKCKKLGARRIEVINFGVGGYNTGIELLALRHHVWNYSPDIVLLAFYSENDIMDNSKSMFYDGTRPYFVLRDGRLELDNSFKDSPYFKSRKSWYSRAAYCVLNYSRVLQVIEESRITLKRILMQRKQRLANLPKKGLMLYLEPTDELWQEAWLITEKLISTMASEVEEKGARFILTALSNPTQAHPSKEVRKKTMKNLGVTDLFYPDRRIEALGERLGFPVITLGRQFQSHAEENQAFLYGSKETKGVGHWNEEGQRLAGKTVAEYICANSLF
ncbi:MAG: SGNH/GDSL hydrolase family protein [bacterium]